MTLSKFKIMDLNYIRLNNFNIFTINFIEKIEQYIFINFIMMKKLRNNEHYILIILGLILLYLDYMKTNTFDSYGVLLIGLGLLIIWAKRVFWKKNK